MVCFAKEIFCVPAEPRTPAESMLNTEPAAKRLKRYLLNVVLKQLLALALLSNCIFLQLGQHCTGLMSGI